MPQKSKGVTDEDIQEVHEVCADFVDEKDFNIFTDFQPRVIFDRYMDVEVKVPVIRDRISEKGYETSLRYEGSEMKPTIYFNRGDDGE